jgi:ribosome-associated heat shock protein Hsp15
VADEPDAGADRLRIDRWLWCARFFKSRSAAADAVRGGHVRVNGQRVKPAHAVKAGDALQCTYAHGNERDVAIVSLPKRRGPPAEAAACYVESAESIERRRRAAEERAARTSYGPPTIGRPDKRTRRLLLKARHREPLKDP